MKTFELTKRELQILIACIELLKDIKAPFDEFSKNTIESILSKLKSK